MAHLGGEISGLEISDLWKCCFVPLGLYVFKVRLRTCCMAIIYAWLTCIYGLQWFGFYFFGCFAFCFLAFDFTSIAVHGKNMGKQSLRNMEVVQYINHRSFKSQSHNNTM